MKKMLTLLLCCFLLSGCDVEEEEKNIDKNEVSTNYSDGQEKANELIEKMENIDWEENYDDAKEKGRKAAEFLNDLLD